MSATALVSGWAWVFFPYSIYLAGGRIYSDALTCLIATLLWLQTLRLERSRNVRDWLVWGALWGLAGLVSPLLLGPLPFLALWLAIRRSRAGLPWLRSRSAGRMRLTRCRDAVDGAQLSRLRSSHSLARWLLDGMHVGDERRHLRRHARFGAPHDQPDRICAVATAGRDRLHGRQEGTGERATSGNILDSSRGSRCGTF